MSMRPARAFGCFALAAPGAALGSIVLVIALAVFAIPSVIAGYALVHGVTTHIIDSAIAINILGGIGGIAIGVAAVVNLKALGSAALSR